jgi:hypothetical protein
MTHPKKVFKKFPKKVTDEMIQLIIPDLSSNELTVERQKKRID